MHRLEEYVTSAGKRMRCGYTTGTCAAAASRAAAELLLEGSFVAAVSVSTPAGIDVIVDVEEHESGEGWAACAVRKDAGDDPDITDGALVAARVERCNESGVHIEGGEGVGRVTREGLDQPVGAAAINSVPRAMIAEQVTQVRERAQSAGTRPVPAGLRVTISVPGGAELAERTFNPRLGIEGGISIIGTSGIVKPMSEDALVASIELEMRMHAAQGVSDLIVAPGSYGRDFAIDGLGLSFEHGVQCSNYIGATLDSARIAGFARVLVVGHIGKMAKVAAGVMNTHSRMADCRLETLAAHAALAGAPQQTVQRIMQAATTEAALDALDSQGLLEEVMESVVEALASRLAQRATDALQVEAVVFSSKRGLLCMTGGAQELLDAFKGA